MASATESSINGVRSGLSSHCAPAEVYPRAPRLLMPPPAELARQHSIAASIAHACLCFLFDVTITKDQQRYVARLRIVTWSLSDEDQSTTIAGQESQQHQISRSAYHTDQGFIWRLILLILQHTSNGFGPKTSPKPYHCPPKRAARHIHELHFFTGLSQQQRTVLAIIRSLSPIASRCSRPRRPTSACRGR